MHLSMKTVLNKGNAPKSQQTLIRQSPSQRQVVLAKASSSDAYQLSRKEAVASILALVAAVPRMALAEEAVIEDTSNAAPQEAPSSTPTIPFKTLNDPTLAYSFNYPTQLSSGQPLSLVMTRKPERYSSAAPLTADARQRIVSELADLRNAITVSVSVGPPSPVLKTLLAAGSPKPRDVAEQVLVDRSTARVTSGQRVSLNSIEEAKEEERGDGRKYVVYEHVSKGSPNLRSRAVETYRHALAVTVERPGLDGSPYLYTLNVSCPEELWPELEQSFRQSINSFTLTTPGSEYVAPDQDPWKFF